MRSLLGGLVLVGVLGITSARADIRIDKPPTPPRPPVTTPATPEAPTPPPAPEPRSQGCAGREMGSEWLFGLAVLAVGLGGMRWQRRRHAATA